MTKTERRTLKKLVDRRRREKVIEENKRNKVKTCSGCGGEMDVWTVGCIPCQDRHSKRRRRGISDYSNKTGSHTTVGNFDPTISVKQRLEAHD